MIICDSFNAEFENTFTLFLPVPHLLKQDLVAAKKMQRGSELGCECVCPLDYTKPCFGWLNQQIQMTQELNKCYIIRLFVISTFFPSPYLL